MRVAAFEHLRRLTAINDYLSSAQLAEGFQFRGERIPLINPQRGIFKPRQMRRLLSIRTVFPTRRVTYDDQREVYRQIDEGGETIDYSFMGKDPDALDNRLLREAMENRVPMVYFLGIAPQKCQAMMPAFIVGFDPAALKARVAFSTDAPVARSEIDDDPAIFRVPDSPTERRYALREVKQRLHQTSFREAVIDAYGGKCALTGLPEPRLLDAAHIVADGDEHFGQPIISNGLPLSKTHHAAFDAHLIGIDPDFTIHISRRLMDLRDGPTLEALQRLNGQKLLKPGRKENLPDRDRLAMRFETFLEMA
jgi:putative restriction endonuclease